MAITVGKLYSNCEALYEMKLLGGHRGLNNLIDWVHIVEDPEVCTFLHGNELVFTAGYMNKTPQWMLNFAENLYRAGVGALVINLGPYTKEVTQDVIDFCNEMNIPLFTIPWKTRMVDITRDFASRIMRNINVEDTITTTVKNMIFKVGNQEADIQQMERYGYTRDAGVCFLNISVSCQDKMREREYVEQIKPYIERQAKLKQPLFVSFRYEEHLIVFLQEDKKEQIQLFVDQLLIELRREKDLFTVFIGVSPISYGFSTLTENFEKAKASNRIAIKKNQRIMYYDMLDLYKILIAVADKNVLKDYYQEVLGKLISYDAENNSNLVGFLQMYLDCGGSPQLVSEQSFIHRNTVNNYIKKIQKITGYNLLDMDEKMRCRMAFFIQDVV